MVRNINIEMPGVTLGILEADDVRVEPEGTELAQLIDKTCQEIRAKFSLETLAEAAPSRAVRTMFRAWGVDPSKYRPSSEALLRRVVQGKGLYRVSNAVDIGNLGSVETGWPFGLYDRHRLAPPITFRHGTRGEMYEGIGKRMWHLEGRPILADAQGPFGSPISDSTRSMITESAREILAVIYAPQSASEASVMEALSQMGERLTRFASARIAYSGLRH